MAVLASIGPGSKTAGGKSGNAETDCSAANDPAVHPQRERQG